MSPRRTTSKRSRTRGAVLFAAALALAAPAPARAGSVASTSGDVEIGLGEPPVWRDAQAGDVLDPGDRVRTGRDGRAEIALDGATIRLYPSSVLRLPNDATAAGGSQAVDLERGSSLFDVLHRHGAAFEVRTPEVVVSVKGTRFGVDLSRPAAAVAVYRGSVGVRGLESELLSEVLVREGFAAVAGGERGFDLLLNTGADPWSAWDSGAAAPALLDAAPPQPPARAALEDARLAARRAADPEVLSQAAQRRPEVAQRIAKLANERALEGGEGRAEERGTKPGTGVDPLVDGARGRALRRELRRDFVESLLNGGPHADGTPGVATAFDIHLVESGGAKLVRIVGPGVDTQLSESQIQTVLSSGNVSTLPAPLLAVLVNQNLDPVVFTNELGSLLADKP